MTMRCEHCSGPCTGHAYILDSGKGVVHQRCYEEYDRHSKGLKHMCPKCKAIGQIDDPTGKTEEAERYTSDPGCAYGGCRGCHYCINSVEAYRKPVQVTCNLCHGVGWLTREAVPVTKIVDWKMP